MIKLEPFEKKDFAQLISWIDSEESLVQFAGPVFTFPLTHDQLADHVADPNRKSFKVVYKKDNRTIGHAEIYLKFAHTARLCRILIGDPEFRGQGLGKKLVEILLEKAYDEFGANTVELNVYEDNTAAIKCYEKAGFKIQQGEAKTTTVNGQTWASLKMKV